MKLKNYQIEILKALIKNEEKLAELYKIYSEKFLNYKDFWLDLIKDEIAHATWIRRFWEKTEQDSSLYFDENRFNLEAINIYSQEVKKQISEAKFSEMTIMNALSTAYYFEIALIERKFFEVFEGDSVELKHTLKDLHAACINHSNKVSKKLKELKN
ncbi:MAG: hypothetical protein KJI70_02420 [Patescibacteria group bacterium]|nr:hypothetical protein [Patescibacteria group bacterium]